MNNLFIMHTQYNLILACGLVKEKHQNDCNDLILYSEFAINDNIKKNLEGVFNRVYYVRESYYNSSNFVLNELHLFKNYIKSRKILKNEYDNFYLTQERFYDTLILSKLNKNKKKLHKCINIEEDIYYSLTNKYNFIGVEEWYRDIKKNINYKSQIKSMIRIIIYGNNRCFEKVYFYGMSKIYDEGYLMFPKYKRSEVIERKSNEITTDMIIQGVNGLYNNYLYEYKQADKYVVFFFDLISRYENKDKVARIIKLLAQYCISTNKVLLYKYHPRETEKFDIKNKEEICFEIPSIIPSEKIMVDLLDKEITVIGNATTSIIVASKLSHQVVSTININKTSNQKAVEFYRNINIYCPNSINELINYLK